MSSIETIQQELMSARAVRQEILVRLGETDTYDPGAMERLQDQGRLITALTTRLSEAQQAATRVVHQPASEGEALSGVAILALLSGGKRDKTLQVPAGSRLGDVLDEIGWDSANYTFKRRTGVGTSVILLEGEEYVLTEGAHEISLVPAVEAG